MQLTTRKERRNPKDPRRHRELLYSLTPIFSCFYGETDAPANEIHQSAMQNSEAAEMNKKSFVTQAH